MDRMGDEERLSRILFRPPAPPTRGETEAFVARLLERLDEEKTGALLRWLTRPWLVPTLGLALASFAVAVRLESPLPSSPFGPDSVAAPVDEEP